MCLLKMTSTPLILIKCIVIKLLLVWLLDGSFPCIVISIAANWKMRLFFPFACFFRLQTFDLIQSHFKRVCRLRCPSHSHKMSMFGKILKTTNFFKINYKLTSKHVTSTYITFGAIFGLFRNRWNLWKWTEQKRKVIFLRNTGSYLVLN